MMMDDGDDDDDDEDDVDDASHGDDDGDDDDADDVDEDDCEDGCGAALAQALVPGGCDRSEEMQGVRYFRTFIDVEDEPTIPGPPRAQSCPPLGTITEKLDEDVAIYVSSLLDRANELTQAPAQAAPLLAPSQGSRGHPDLCNRPCIFFVSGSCHLGSTCGHCHLAHPQRAARLDKRQRVAVQALSDHWFQ
eukprot:s6453_g4.t1